MRRFLLMCAILVAALWVAGEAAWACKFLGCVQGRRGGHGCGGCCEAVSECCEPASCRAVTRTRCGPSERGCAEEESACCEPHAPAAQPAPSPSDVTSPTAPAKPKPAAPTAPAKVVAPPKPAAPPAVKAPSPPAPPKAAEQKAPAPAAAPAKAEAPKLPPAPAPEKKALAPARRTSALDQGLRSWTDDTGQHRLVARLVSVLEGDVVRLQRDDGTYVRVALDRLSVGDRQYVSAARGTLAAR